MRLSANRKKYKLLVASLFLGTTACFSMEKIEGAVSQPIGEVRIGKNEQKVGDNEVPKFLDERSPLFAHRAGKKLFCNEYTERKVFDKSAASYFYKELKSLCKN